MRAAKTIANSPLVGLGRARRRSGLRPPGRGVRALGRTLRAGARDRRSRRRAAVQERPAVRRERVGKRRSCCRTRTSTFTWIRGNGRIGRGHGVDLRPVAPSTCGSTESTGHEPTINPRASTRVRVATADATPAPMKARSFISLGDFTPEAIDHCLELAAELKAARAPAVAATTRLSRIVTSRSSSTSRHCARA